MEVHWELEEMEVFRFAGEWVYLWSHLLGDDGVWERFAHQPEARAVLAMLRDARREVRLVKVTREVVGS